MKKLLLYSLSLAIVALSTVTAYASIPASDGTITGCYKPSDGKLFVIDSTATCPSGTNTLTWNQTGPQGLTGATGATRATGATGATGPQGPAGVIASNSVLINTAQTVSVLHGSYQDNVGWTTIAGGDNFTITLSETETVMITSQVGFSHGSCGGGSDSLCGTGIGEGRYLVDGTSVVNPNGSSEGFQNDQLYFLQDETPFVYLVTLSSGTHTFAFQVKGYIPSGGPDTAQVDQTLFVVMGL